MRLDFYLIEISIAQKSLSNAEKDIIVLLFCFETQYNNVAYHFGIFCSLTTL